MADTPTPESGEEARPSASFELIGLIRKLANAEAELRQAISGRLDGFLHPDGYLFLLGDAQRALLENEYRYRTLFEASPDALATFSAESGLFVQVNERTKQLLGMRAELLLLGPLHVSPETQPDGRRSLDVHRANVERALAGETLVYEWEFRAADGRPLPCEVRLVRLPAAEVHAACLATIVDLTERRRIAAEVADAERNAKDNAGLVQALVDSVPDLIWQVDLDGRVSFVNRVPADLRDTEVVGGPWLVLASREHWMQLAVAFSELTLSGNPTECEFEGAGADGARRWYSARLGPVKRDEATVAVVVIARDITEKRRTEAQLIASDRMASVGTLAAGVAHEINNPLSVVLANLELVSEQLTDSRTSNLLPPGMLEELRDARGAAERVRHIVKDIKVFSRGSEESVEPVDVQRVLDSTLRLALNEVRHRARLVKDYAPIPTALANESRLGQVFLNLVVNAAQAIPDGNAASNEVRVKTRLDADGAIVVSIADTGQGIPPEVQKRLFTPFVTTKPVGVGTGLGLSICQRIVTGFGGRIEFSSEVGRGTEFRVVLPVSARPETVRPRPASTPARAARRGRLLIIDDDIDVAQALCRTLEPEHDVSVVTSARMALTRLKVNAYDLVLCDLMMPEMAGVEVRREFRRVHPEQVKHWLFVTGGAFTPEAREALEAETHYIEKPFEVQSVRTIINGLIAD